MKKRKRKKRRTSRASRPRSGTSATGAARTDGHRPRSGSALTPAAAPTALAAGGLHSIDARPEPAQRTEPHGADGPIADAVSLEALDALGLPIVTALAAVAGEPGPTLARLERAIALLRDAYASADSDLSRLLVAGWIRAREDKHWRLRLAWQREQLRLSLQDILTEGAVRGELRDGLDAGAVAAVIIGTAEGCLLQAASEGGPVSAADLARTLVGLTRRGA